MGRKLKRVALDFAWPQNQGWEGYLNPFNKHSVECPDCGGTGSSPTAQHLTNQWYGNAPFEPKDRGSSPFAIDNPTVRSRAEHNVATSPGFYGSGERSIECEAQRLADHFNSAWSHHLNSDDVAALVEAGRLYDLTHTWTQNNGWEKKEPACLPSPEEVNVWSLSGIGHDSINQCIVVAAECKRLGISSGCAHCDGEGRTWSPLEGEKQADEWQPIEPPDGPGFQLWETVTEGAPVSPVFATAEELAHWLVAGVGYKLRENDNGTSYEQWLAFIKGPGSAPSFVIDENGFRSGVVASA